MLFTGDAIEILGAVQLYDEVEEFLGLTDPRAKSVELLFVSVHPLFPLWNESVLLVPVVGNAAVSNEVAVP